MTAAEAKAKGYERCPVCNRWGIHLGVGGTCPACEAELPGRDDGKYTED
jgi:hypothetical protein